MNIQAYLEYTRNAKKEKKVAASKPTHSIEFTSFQIQGKRPSQEDRFMVKKINSTVYLFLLADGHGGSACVDFVMQVFPKFFMEEWKTTETIKDIFLHTVKSTNDAWSELVLGDPQARVIPEDATDRSHQEKIFSKIDWATFHAKQYDSGTTLLATLIDVMDGSVYLCHLGDSRTVLQINDFALIATRDHGVPHQLAHKVGKGVEKQIKTTGGRLEGDLAMSASVGDYTPDILGVPRTIPDFQKMSLPKNQRMVLVMASDGLFETVDQTNLFLNPYTSAEAILKDIGLDQFEDNTTLFLIHLDPIKS